MRRTGLHYQRERRKGMTYSAVMHVLFLLLIIIGLPSFLQPDPPEEPAAITVELVPITGITNIKPSETPPAEEPKPEEKAAEDKKPAPPTKSEAPPPPPKPEPKPEEAVVVKKEEKKPEPKKEEKKPEKKPEEKKKPKQDDFAKLLEDLKKDSEKQKPKPDPKKTETTSPSKSFSTNYNPEIPMSLSEKDAVMSQLSACWTVPAGAKDAQNLLVVLDAEFNSDGSNLRVQLAPESVARYQSDSFFRAAADSAIRAVKMCSPLKNLPPEKFQTWRIMKLRFDPKFMLQ